MINALLDTEILHCALISHDEAFCTTFERACDYCKCIPIIAESGVALMNHLENNQLHHVVLDLNLPEETINSIHHTCSGQSAWSYIPFTAVASGLHQTISTRYMFSHGITASIERTDSPESLAAIISGQIRLFERWLRFADDIVLDEKIRICMNNMNPGHRDSTDLQNSGGSFTEKIKPLAFDGFIERLCTEFSLNERKQKRLHECMPEYLYDYAQAADIPRSYVLKLLSEYLMLPHITSIDSEKLQLGNFPPQFCRTHKIVPLNLYSNSRCLALGNPFDWELIEFLANRQELNNDARLVIADPEMLEGIFSHHDFETAKRRPATIRLSEMPLDEKSAEELEKHIFEAAYKERATDIHIEPKAESTIVRFRVDGDLHDFANLHSAAAKLICRLKAKADMDISESRRPQDGVFYSKILGKPFRVRVASTLAQFGESLAMRLLETDAGLKNLTELGMHDSQEHLLLSLSAMHSGMLLFVGPTGSGKTTTIYSTINHIDCLSRSLISVEDPIEYSIPHANQQQVNDKSGNSFEVLLKSSVRLDPDILYVGEIRDINSAKIAMDFTSTGRLTITSMHTTNATTALFRLERLGISRAVISEAVLAIIAQRLVKKLCNDCKKIMPLNHEDRIMLKRYFGNNLPDLVAYPAGCDRCNYTGYYGRTGICEIVHFTPEIADMVATNRSICEIRHLLIARGDFMMPCHALEKIKDLICSPLDIHSTVLLEESPFSLSTQEMQRNDTEVIPQKADDFGKHQQRLLVVEDDTNALTQIENFLKKQGYTVDSSTNGLDALVKLSSASYGLILSDIMVPGLDGFRLLEIMKQKNIVTPVILMTALSDESAELHGFELGAVDYIHKPVKLDILKMRIDRFFLKS